MNYRHTEILANTDLGASGTEPIGIEIDDPISAITVVHQPVGGSNTPAGHPVKNIEKIEVIDGSDVLYGCSGYQGQALNIFGASQPVIQEIDARAGGTPLVYIHLMFGRKFWDSELALDPRKHDNLQLKLKWNRVNYDAACTSTGTMVYGHVFDGKVIDPVGFLSSKQEKEYTPTSGGWEYTTIPNDYPLRRLMLKGLKAGAGIRGLIEWIKLDENNDKKIVIDGDIHNLRSFLDEMGGDCIDHIVGSVGTTSAMFYCTPSNVFSHVSDGETKDRVIASGLPIGGRLWFIAQTGTTIFNAHLQGKNPHGCVCIPFGDQKDLNDWWDVTAVKKVRLSIKGGTSSVAGDSVEVVTEQLRRYA
ncbi:MAG: hypothetical protein HWN68_11100 [Desulfobacterales bacterium]|nr:hypothetical protein [Desulfobacterales bacterium]